VKTLINHFEVFMKPEVFTKKPTTQRTPLPKMELSPTWKFSVIKAIPLMLLLVSLAFSLAVPEANAKAGVITWSKWGCGAPTAY